MEKVCGECKHNSYIRTVGGFCCGNEESENYGTPTAYDDGCDDFEEKE